ncbi:MAG: DUF1501 domain-containing protein [Isosphaeraceae bacterium]
MLRGTSGCDEFRSTAPSRRQAIRVGALAGLGLTLPDLLRARALADESKGTPADPTFGRARSVIMLYLHGGPAQHETWDPKPAGPAPERGEFGAIATSVPGVRFGEHLPRSARLMHRMAVIRSLTHPNANHVQAALAAMTGRHHPPGTEARGDFPPSPTDFPAIGAALDLLRPPGRLPSWVQVGPTMTRSNGTVLHGQSPGFLGATHGPLVIDQDLTPKDARVEAVSPDGSVDAARLGGRRTLLDRLDAQRRAVEGSAPETLDAHQRRALDLLTAPAIVRAFDLGAERPEARDAYGRNSFGQSCLLARRLAEAGVPMISVHYCRRPPGWDTHGRHFAAMKNDLGPTLDRAFAALVTDLDRRGLLDTTVVWINSEFGRTPRINTGGGRDHWPWAYSLALAGGGLAGGVCLGDRRHRRPPDPGPARPGRPRRDGLPPPRRPPDTEVRDPLGRPFALVNGRPIRELLA